MLLIYLTVLCKFKQRRSLEQNQDNITFPVKDAYECHLSSFRSRREKPTTVEKSDGIRK